MFNSDYYGRKLDEVPPRDKSKLNDPPKVPILPTPVAPPTIRDMSTGQEHTIRSAPTTKTQKL